MLRLSIIIPVLGDAQKLDDTLVSVLEHRPAHCEVLVVLNQPYDDPYQLGNEVRFVEAWRGAGLAECLNLGVSASRSPLLHVLTCGIEACANWTHAAVRCFRDPDVASVAAMVLRSDDRSLVVSAGVGYCAEGSTWRMGEGEPFTDVALRKEAPGGPDLLAAFYRKSALEAVGGFAPCAGDSFVGADLALRLQRAGFPCALEAACLTHGAPATVVETPSFSRGCAAERLFWRWASYHGWTRSLLGHVAMLAGECVTGLLRPARTAQCLGRAWGAVQAILQRNRSATRDIAAPRIVPSTHFVGGEGCVKPQRPARVA